MLPVTFNPTSTRCPAPTTTLGTNDENFDTADPSVGFKLASSSTYTLPLSSTSVLGTLKIVCWPNVRARAPQSIANKTSTRTLVMKLSDSSLNNPLQYRRHNFLNRRTSKLFPLSDCSDEVLWILFRITSEPA